MRLLLNEVDPEVAAGGELSLALLGRLYAYPDLSGDRTRWLRANMVSTLDGAATGPDGRTGSINNEADRLVFGLLRALSDVVVVGAGTARAEGYGRPQPPRAHLAALRDGRPPAPTLAVVSRTANLPLQLAARPDRAGLGEVMLVTCEAASPEALAAARAALGRDRVLVVGEEGVDPVALVDRLVARGLPRMLTEGGPRLLRDLTAAGVVDEICLTVVPEVLAGDHPRILDGGQAGASFRPRLLLEAEGTLLGRWQRAGGGQP